MSSRHPDLGLAHRRVGGGLVARFPVPDVVVGLVRTAVGTEDGRIGQERLVRVDDDLERLVVDEDRGGAIGRDVAAGRDDRGDLLGLVHDRVGRQDHLLVAGEGRHPVQPGLLEVGAGDHREDAGDRQRLRRVDALDPGVGVRAPDDVEPEHARQDEVVDVLALAPDEARILLALDGVAHAPDFGRGLQCVCGHLVRLAQLAAAGSAGASDWVAAAARISAAACSIDLTMFT